LSISRWLEGAHPGNRQVNDNQTSLAEQLADVILALRKINVSEVALKDPRLRWYRGRPIAEFDQVTRKCLSLCRNLEGLDLDLDHAEAVWAKAMELPESQIVKPDFWYHSDLVTENLIVRNGQLAAILDFGASGIGDPTVDIHAAWELFDQPAREDFRERLDISDSEWVLARAWALGIAVGAFSYYWRTMPQRMQDRLVMAQGVLEDS